MSNTSDNEKGSVECNTLVFFDLETTGLPAHHSPRITELSFYGIDKKEFMCGKFKEIPRVVNRLNLCIYPSRLVDPVASEKTKLDNYNLENQGRFDEDVFNIINSFLKRQKGPVCLIAHNGMKFDFPILRSEVAKLGKELPSDVLCADSEVIFHDIRLRNSIIPTGLPALALEKQTTDLQSPVKSNYVNPFQQVNETTPVKRKLDNQQGTPNHSPWRKHFKLEDIFESYHGQKPRVVHTAEADVVTLLLSAIAASPTEFLKSLSVNAIPLTAVKKCW